MEDEDYKKKYEKAIKRAEAIIKVAQNQKEVYGCITTIFPELRESEDERIRKELINFFSKGAEYDSSTNGIKDRNIIAWLEKQDPKKHEEELEKAYKCADEVQYRKGYEDAKREIENQNEQKPTDKVEPKFKVGDWIINSEGMLRHIVDVDKTGYQTDNGWLTHDIYDNTYHIWTIQDARDGDVLAYENDIVIFKENNYNSKDKSGCMFVYCSCNNFYEIGGINPTDYKPATKEQRDLLFQKMKDAGYEWDSEKKELKKIETHYDIKNFHAGMPVLVRIYNNHKWCYSLFSHCYKHQGILHFSCGGAGWLQCIPFEGNEHLLGTTDMCNEKFINW